LRRTRKKTTKPCDSGPATRVPRTGCRVVLVVQVPCGPVQLRHGAFTLTVEHVPDLGGDRVFELVVVDVHHLLDDHCDVADVNSQLVR